ncbi:hypothetical protein DUNSADRAFT_17722 [Dunaliella salina]|uniref:NADH:flavin oxidoreductase/NADH oxidase N-terminal domain-containing protein n=1 Tax=Dunaliella salina TaxID=3046 RepID=A0ABQ7GZX4_DUNSA|nr:hypothetical protein DUNSADRAFT_17722 [Dunaliella salina]|eukprot:KAF5840121.1 hypothetical protein DUNSADRAFT_17722 [Dunaliella salina]
MMHVPAHKRLSLQSCLSRRVAQNRPLSGPLRSGRKGVRAVASNAAEVDVAPLFQPFKLPGGEELQNRMVYPPLTRCRALDTIPRPIMAEYYGQRACPGSLLICEATVVDRDGQGYPHVPGVFTREQVEAWKPIVKTVRDKGAVFFCQLWHSGRASHPVYQPDGKLPVSSSEEKIASEQWKNCYLGDGKMGEYPVPTALNKQGIKDKVQAFRVAARNAIEAGFNGVELHAANGYLIDQFTKDGVNKRTDEYGGSLENRCKFALEVVAAVVEEIGPERVGIRLSPFATFLDAIDSTPYATFVYLVEKLSATFPNMAYLHMVEPRADGHDILEDCPLSLTPFRKVWKGPFIVSGGYTRESGAAAVESGEADFVAYGRLWLSNPDLPLRFKQGAELNPYDRNTFYTHGKEGYIDYPFWEGAK